jgi:hypothetical protein
VRRAALLLLLCLGTLAALAAPALATGTQPAVTGWVNNASPSLPAGSATVGWDAGPLSETQDVAVSGNYAYVPSYFDGTLTAVDLTDTSAPAVDALSSIGTVPSNGTQLVGADSVNVFNGVAYVLSKNLNASNVSNDIGTGNSLTMFDVSGANAGSPVYLGSYTDANNLFGAYGVAVASNGGQTYAYVAAQGCLSNPQPCPNGGVGNNFVVLNVTNPASPTFVTEIHNSGTGTFPNAIHHPTAVVISGNYAYVTSFYGADVAVIDISNPASPQIVATIPNDANSDSAWPNDLAISGHYLLIDNQAGGGPIAIVDISNPTSPVIVGSISSPYLNNAYRIAVYGDFAYVTGTSAASIAAIDISNPMAPRLAGFVTDSTNLLGTTGVDVMPTAGGLYVVATSTHQTGEGGSDLYPPYPPGISSYSSPPTPPFSYGTSGNTDKTGTVAAIQVDPVPNSVTITPSSEPPSSTTQTSASFSFATADAVATVACSLDSGPSAPCTSATTMNYTGLAVGSHTFTVQSTDASGGTTSDQYSWTVTPPSGVPVNSQPPTITGTAQPGQTLTEVNGTWSNGPTSYAYQWEDCDSAGNNCQPISGATGSTYKLTSADIGSTIVVTEAASNSLGAGAPVASSHTQVVTATPVNTQLPVISGTTAQGYTLSVSTGTWTGGALTYTYAWGQCDATGQNCGVINGATASTYTLTAANVGHEIQVKVFAHNSAGSTTAKSQPTAVVTACPAGQTGSPPNCATPHGGGSTAPVNNGAPTVSGRAIVGGTLNGTTGKWSGTAPNFTYAWGECNAHGTQCSPVRGATGPTYRVTKVDVGHTIVLKVTATNSAGSASAKSAPTAVVVCSSCKTGTPPAVKAKPIVIGTMSVGQVVGAGHGTWSGSGIRYAYAWSRCAAHGSSCHAIPRATHAVYRPVEADAGRRLMVTVTATDRGGSTKATSARTAIIARRSVSLAVDVTTASGQHVGSSNTLVVRVRAQVSALIGAYAAIKVGKASAFETTRVMGQSRAGQALRVTLHLTRAQLSQLRAGLAHGLTVMARIYPVRGVAPHHPVAISGYRQIRIVS